VTEHEEDTARAYDHQLVRRLAAYLAPYKWQVALAVFVTLLQAAVQLMFPWLTKEAIDLGIRHKDLYALDRIALLYLASLLAAFGLGYAQSQIMQGVAQRVMRDLRTTLFRKLQELPASYYDKTPVGRLMTRVTNDVDVLNEMFTSGVDALFGDIFMLIGIIVAMANLNVELLAVTFSVLPLIFLVTMTFRIRVRKVFRDVRSKLARLNAFLNENLTGMTTVQLLGRERRNAGEFDAINAEHRDANLLANTYHAVFFPLLEVVSAIALSLIVWYGGRQVMWTGITLGTLVAFIQYTQRFFRPISDLSEKYGILQQAMASSERIFELLDTPVDPAAVRFDQPAPSPPARDGGAERGLRIEFDHVWFAYLGEHWVLKDVSFTLERGEKLALVGATGSGKSTIASLLLRFYTPQKGEIRVDGRPLADWNAEELRQRIGLVLQDVFLFSGPVEANLRMDDPRLSREQVVAAAHEVHADEFISRIPGGYDGELRERGASLSAGEKQLLSFARTLARDPDLLILDEATSSVDTHTEQLIQAGLHRLMRDRSSLVIAHRLSTIQDVDRIVVLHHGEVREMGTHAELMALEGLYSRLWQLQYLGGRQGARHTAPVVTPTDL
jgi:ATP-binding cassette subfamily B protein